MAVNDKSASTIRALRIGSLFAIAVSVGLMALTLMGIGGLPVPVSLMLLVAGLALGTVASAKARKDQQQP